MAESDEWPDVYTTMCAECGRWYEVQSKATESRREFEHGCPDCND